MKKLVIFCFFLFSLTSVKAQNIGNLLLASDDASLLSQKYLNPAIGGMLSGINSGWYTTAKTHKKFGFDLTIGMSASFTPDKDQTFDFNNSSLLRNTFGYRIAEPTGDNDFIIESNEIKRQKIIVDSISEGSVSSINILNSGEDYKVGEKLKFDNSGTSGGGLTANISSLKERFERCTI